MRARITYLAVSPRTPQRIAQRVTEGLVLAAGAAGLGAVVSGAVSHAFFGAIVQVHALLGGVA